MAVLLFYSTTDGQTLKIAKRLSTAFPEPVEIKPISKFSDCVDRDDIDLLIIGASIRYGTFNKGLVALINQHADFLNHIRSAFYSVCLTARKTGRDKPEENNQLQELIQKTGWRPIFKAVFAGQLDYPRYNFFDRQMIRLIMKLTGGCTDGKSTIEYTDWGKVNHFATLLSNDKSDIKNPQVMLG